jgi:hypothetical protein
MSGNKSFGVAMTENLSRAEKFELNKTRRTKILTFLADGEYWTTAENVKLLLDVSQITYARRLLNSMCDDGVLAKKNISFGGSMPRNFYHLTQSGLDYLGYDERLKDTTISFQTAQHNETVQRLKITALSLNLDLTWQSEIQLKRAVNFASIPDSLLEFNNKKISIELQRNIINQSSFEKKIAKCLRDVYAKNFDKILYICCDNLKPSELRNLFNKIKTVKNSKFENVVLLDNDKAKFDFIDVNDFMEYIKNA